MNVDMNDQKKFSVALSEWQKHQNDKSDVANLASGVGMALAHKMIAPFKNITASDTVKLTHAEDEICREIVGDYFKVDDEPNAYECPGDLFFADTVPIKNIEIVVDETSLVLDNGQNGFISTFRVDIFDNLTEIIDGMGDAAENRFRCIGAGSMKFPHIGIVFYALIIVYGKDHIHVLGLMDDIRYMPKAVDVLPQLASGFIGECLVTWYAVQVFLLNPVTKEIFENPNVVKYQIKPGTQNNKTGKRKIGYKRIHVLNKKDLEKRLYGGDRKIHRKCLCWYVIGHWRSYKDGHKTFVQGYWKGALRDTKMNHDEGRERVVME